MNNTAEQLDGLIKIAESIGRTHAQAAADELFAGADDAAVRAFFQGLEDGHPIVLGSLPRPQPTTDVLQEIIDTANEDPGYCIGANLQYDERIAQAYMESFEQALEDVLSGIASRRVDPPHS